MPVKKIAISVPQEVLKQVDRLAKRVGNTRSGFITSVLVDVARAGSRLEVTEKINAIFDDPELQREQSETSRAFLTAAAKSPFDPDSPGEDF